MSFINKVGNMLSKKTISKNSNTNKYKPAGVHVLGEDDFSSNNIISEDSITPDFQDDEKQSSVTISGSSNILPYIAEHKSLTKLMDIQKPQPQKKDKKEESDVYKGFILMNGEKKFRTDNCYIKIDDKTFASKVILTPYRVFIIPDFKKKNPDDFSYINFFPDNFFSLFLHKIDKTVKTSNEKSLDFSLDIIMKDQRTFSLIFKINGVNFFDQLNGLIALREQSHQNIATEYRKNNPIYKKENFQDGWNLYNPEEEYARQGITDLDYEVNRNKLFRKTKLNENYSLCPSYPKFLITVGEITDSDYKCSAEFRTKSRLPALAYYHKANGGTIWRSAQTRSGISGNRNRFDEDLLLDITKVSKCKKLYIYDCRPYLSAVANKLKGAGFENVENYPGSEIFFCEIDNIHTARNALNKIYSMLKSNRFSDNKKFFSSFESSEWPRFIFGIILACANIASAVRRGYSVLIHCSDGWDRCSQLTAFSQLLIDPYFRTIKGYMTLIEKDFLSFGHQFRLRNGYYTKEEKSENQTSPILLQFLDATHQLLVQYPMYFEFNMKFLLFIANSINTGLYGTFLYDCEKDREKQNAKNKTMSCWTEILNNINYYKNQFYEEKSRKVYFLIPNFPMNRIRLWEEYFLPFTQINLNILYDNYINRFQENFYFNIFGQMKQKSRIISNVQYMIKEKENQEKEKENLLKEITKLKNAISELTIKNNIKKEFFEGLSKETKNTINNVAKEEGGEINLNEELNMYCFKKIEKPIEIKEEEPIKNNKIEDKKETSNEKEEKEKIEKKEQKENIFKNEKKEKINEQNKKPKKDENKKINSINQSKINMFFGLNTKDVNKKTDNNINKKESNKEENKTSEEQKEKTDKIDSDVKKDEENKNREEIKNDEENKKDDENKSNVQSKNDEEIKKDNEINNNVHNKIDEEMKKEDDTNNNEDNNEKTNEVENKNSEEHKEKEEEISEKSKEDNRQAEILENQENENNSKEEPNKNENNENEINNQINENIEENKELKEEKAINNQENVEIDDKERKEGQTDSTDNNIANKD